MIARVLPPAHSALTLAAIVRGVASSVTGDPAGALRAHLRARAGVEQVLLTDSGTSALRLAIATAVARAPGRPIAIPTWACYDVLSAALGSDAALVFYDLDPETLAPSTETIARLAAAAPAAVVLVHAFGVPVDVPALRRQLPPEVRIVEDAAQAWGTTLDGRSSTSGGDDAVVSFGRGKGITGGSGGALLRRSAAPAFAAEAEAASLADSGALGLRDAVASAALWLLTHPTIYGIPASIPALKLGETHFKHPHPAAAMTRVAAGIVAASITAADRAAAIRRDHVAALRQSLARHDGVRFIHTRDGARPGWLRLPLLARDAATRDALLRRGRSLGLAASYPRPLPALARELGVVVRLLHGDEGAQVLSERLFTAPTHGLLTTRDLARITDVLSAA